MVQFKSFKGNETDILIDVEINGEMVKKPIIISGSLYQEGVIDNPYFISYEQFIEEKDDILAQFPGYHFITKAEVATIKSFLTTWYNDDGSPKDDNDSSSRAILGWKDSSELPGGMTGPDYVVRVMGIDYCGVVIAPEIGEEPEFDPYTIGRQANFIIGDSLIDPIDMGYTNVNSGFSTTWALGSLAKRIYPNIVLVKDYE